MFFLRIAKLEVYKHCFKKLQTDFIKKNSKVIIEGRDIASKIMPNADLKIFFKCSLNEKAKRRLKEFKKLNNKIKLKDVKKALKIRDYNDKIVFESSTIDSQLNNYDGSYSQILSFLSEN